ncbi:hypothetical protein BH11PLA1_BH11PLA1_11030 [soil metagenome]
MKGQPPEPVRTQNSRELVKTLCGVGFFMGGGALAAEFFSNDLSESTSAKFFVVSILACGIWLVVLGLSARALILPGRQGWPAGGKGRLVALADFLSAVVWLYSLIWGKSYLYDRGVDFRFRRNETAYFAEAARLSASRFPVIQGSTSVPETRLDNHQPPRILFAWSPSGSRTIGIAYDPGNSLETLPPGSRIWDCTPTTVRRIKPLWYYVESDSYP